MPHVFISYSRRDTETVDAIVERLEKAGIKVWIDREGIHAGRQWRVQIVEAIDTAQAFVLNVSKSSVASVNVLKELNLAEGISDPFVLPFLLEDVKIPAEMRYQLAGVQQIFYYVDPDKAYNELEATLQKRMGIEPAKKVTDRREIEIVVKGEVVSDFDEEKKNQLLALLAESTGVSVDDLAVTRIELGSIHVFVEMPRQAGYVIKTMALNNDAKLVQGGIQKLRFADDKNFVSLDNSSVPVNPKKALYRPLTWILVGLLLFALLLAGIFLPEREGTDSQLRPTEVLPSETPVWVASETPTSTPTEAFSTVIPTATGTSLASLAVKFWMEPEQIDAGQCATLMWRVENAEKVFLGSTEMEMEDRYSDCFCNPDTYTLTVIDLFGEESKHRLGLNVVGSCGDSNTGNNAAPEPTSTVLPG